MTLSTSSENEPTENCRTGPNESQTAPATMRCLLICVMPACLLLHGAFHGRWQNIALALVALLSLSQETKGAKPSPRCAMIKLKFYLI
jgi:hypothetical protein